MNEPDNPSRDLADAPTLQAWLRAATAGQAAMDLESIYRRLAGEVVARSPICTTSGRCCKFESWGHRLYVTGLEAAYAWARLEGHARPTAHTVRAALERGGCPFQPDLLCTIHTIRPLGCRVFFCDQAATQWQEDVYERYLREVRSIHDDQGVPYIYAEWRALLALLADAPAAREWPTVIVTNGGSSPPPAPASPAPTVGLTIRGSEPAPRPDERT